MKKMEHKEQKKSLLFTANPVSITLLIVCYTLAILMWKPAWSRFQQAVNGNATATVAKWSFKLKDGDNLSENGINFPMTRTDNNTTVVPTKLAPGTYGYFEIEVDTSRN